MNTHRFPTLFTPLKIGNVTLKNRIVSTGHETALADATGISDALIAYHEARAKGGAGLIVVEVALIDDAAVFVNNPIKVTSDECIPRYRQLAQTVQQYDCRLFGQLFHPGRELLDSLDGSAPVSYAPSAVPNERFHIMPTPMTHDDIGRVIKGFGEGARRLKAAGLDGVELVASHGYLLSQFLNPRINLRDDDYGGDFERRLRLLQEIIASVRSAAGDDFVVGIRISGDERSHDGLTGDEITDVCRALADDGQLDFYSVVVGSSSSLAGSVHIIPPMSMKAGYIAPHAGRIRAVVDKPVIATGRINQPQIAETLISAGQADACGMTRAMICDPELGNKAQAQQAEDIRVCIACNQACAGHFMRGYPISCIQYPESGRELAYGTPSPAEVPKRVMVVGGGPGGMKAAATAAQRGHQVTLYEAEPALGGQALLAGLLPARQEFSGIARNLAREMEQVGVKIHTGIRVDEAFIAQESPDTVVLATGAKPRRPQLKVSSQGSMNASRNDADGGRAERDQAGVQIVDAWQVLRGEVALGESVAIADWRADWIGIGIADLLASKGHQVRMYINGYMPGQTIVQYARDIAVGRLHKLGVEWTPYVRLLSKGKRCVHFQHTMSGEPVICEGVDSLVLCLGHERVADLYDSLRDMPVELHMVGDCLTPRTAEEAVLEGMKVGRAI